ncbi:hypothetical protein B0T24DRAFT_532739 [Lasiosphaeria ovina]|uniref:Uncharacterized protein n=1 Tax=Lasiosphaeria ovina TaxID=92902 RepID=A0AAE0N3H1_9PEZI|nr:hypothetical protein B0T24DRAFT_532739 [Lasiosphaeria ovina]
MAPSVLGIGLPATSDIVPWIVRGFLRKSLDVMEADMTASPYDWEMLYLTPDMSFDVCTKKLGEKKWDVVMVGMGLRKTDALVPYFERIVNAVHEELPQAKFAFNISIEKTREAVDRVLAGEKGV